MQTGDLRDKSVTQARDRLDEAIYQALEHLITEWAKANCLTLDKSQLEQGLDKIASGAR